MKIKTDSIIYKFLEEGFFPSQSHIPDNLCPYMRNFIFFVIVELALGFLAAMAIQAIIWAPIAIFFRLDIPPDTYSHLLFILGAVLWILSSVVAIIAAWIYAFRKQGYVRQVLNQARTRWEGNIFVRWIQAIHDKVCPNLEFIDEDNL